MKHITWFVNFMGRHDSLVGRAVDFQLKGESCPRCPVVVLTQVYQLSKRQFPQGDQ